MKGIVTLSQTFDKSSPYPIMFRNFLAVVLNRDPAFPPRLKSHFYTATSPHLQNSREFYTRISSHILLGKNAMVALV
jgi:hypothetical protein